MGSWACILVIGLSQVLPARIQGGEFMLEFVRVTIPAAPGVEYVEEIFCIGILSNRYS